MSYTVLARRYRSRDFDEIVGQQPVVRTLKNAIEQDRTAHAYLFCGTRGVGKTSMARILARTLNATDELSEKDKIADAILRGDDLDVIEIDGASNRGVNEARDLIAGAGLSPTRCPYKIYIIDEVHMLTREAFNALLKTMEEPPSHVKFILCTTEPHKVPPTIQSRCQRFDFRPLSVQEIAGQLRHILDEENIKADDDVVRQVARLGNGSMRDALSLLDRLLATGESPLTLATIEQMLGLPDQSLIMELIEAFTDGDAASALKLGNDLLMRGSTEEQVMDMLAAQFRNLMVLCACGNDSELTDLTVDARERASALAEQFDAPALVHMIVLCDSTAKGAKGSANARALFDAVLVRLALAERFADVSALLRGDGAAVGSTSGRAGSKKKVSPPQRDELSRPRTASTQPAPTPAAPPTEAARQPAANAGSGDGQPDGLALWQAVESAELRPAERRKIDLLTYRCMQGRVLVLGIKEAGLDQAKFLIAQAPVIEAIVERVTGCRVSIRIDAPVDRPSPAQRDDQPSLKPPDDPLVAEAMDLFDAVVVEVTPVKHQPG